MTDSSNDSLLKRDTGPVTEAALRLGDIRKRVAHISRPATSVEQSHVHPEDVLKQVGEIKKGMGAALPHIECFSDAVPALSCEQVGTNHVVYVGEVPRLQTISVDF